MALAGWAGVKHIINIDNTKIDSSLSNFPVNLILSTSAGINDKDLTDIFTEIGSNANRKKIAIALSDDTTEAYIEIERWDNANKKASLHVKVPNISSTNLTTLYLYADSSHADNTTYVGDTGDAVAENVWDSNYEAVFHFAQDPSGGAPQLTDSTSNSNDGTSYGTMTSGDLVDAGVGSVQKAWDFDITDDYAVPGRPLILGANQQFTVEALFKPATSTQYFNIWSNFQTVSGNGYIYGQVAYGANGKYDKVGMVAVDSTGTTSAIYYDSPVIDANLSYAEFKKDGENHFTLALNDLTPEIPSEWPQDGTSSSYDEMGENWKIGQAGSTGGLMVEFRVSSITRTDSWRKATYYTLTDDLVRYGNYADIGVTLPSLSATATTPAGDVDILLPGITLNVESYNRATVNIALTSLQTDVNIGMVANPILPAVEAYSEGDPTQFFNVDIELPMLELVIKPGVATDIEIPVPVASVSGIHAYPFNTNIILPSLQSSAYTGATSNIEIPVPEFIITGLQGVVGNFDQRLPSLTIEAYMNVLQTGSVDVKLKKLLVEASATVGRAWSMNIALPKLGVVLTAKFGGIANTNIELPKIKADTINAYSDIKTNTDINIPS